MSEGIVCSIFTIIEITFESFSCEAIAILINLSPPIASTMVPKIRAVVAFAGMFLCLAPLLSNNVTTLCIVKFSASDSIAALESARMKRFVSAIFISNMVSNESIVLIEFVFGPEKHEKKLVCHK